MTTLKLTRKTMLTSAICLGAFIGVAAAMAAWPLGIDPPWRMSRVALVPLTNTAVDSTLGPDLRTVDVNLRRPIETAAADSSAKAINALPSANSWKLIGTSVDEARPMALLMSPDGTAHWLAVGERSDDGIQVKSVTSAGATVLTGGEIVDLKLPPAAADPFSADISAQ